VKFNDLVNFVLEDVIDSSDTPLTLSKGEVDSVKKKSNKQLSIEDNEKREFELVWDWKKHRTYAKSKGQAISNIGYRIASDNNLKPNAIVSKMKRDNNIRVKDLKWNVTY